MTRIVISSRDAERIARSFNDLIGPKGLDRIRRKAVNEIGSSVRKQTRSLAGVVFGTSAAALMVRGQAARPGSTDPAYKLKMASKIPIAKLKAKHRKVTTRRGKKSLTIDTPADPAIRFLSIRRAGAKFILLEGRAAGRTVQVGGVVDERQTRAFTKDDGYPKLYQLRRKAERDLPEAVAKAINDHLAKARR